MEWLAESSSFHMYCMYVRSCDLCECSSVIKVTGSSSEAISIPPVPAQDPSPLNLASVKFLLSTCDSVSWFLESTASASLLLGEADGILAWAEHLASCLDALQVCTYVSSEER